MGGSVNSLLAGLALDRVSLDLAVKATNPRARRLIVQHWREAQVKATIQSCNECPLGEGANRVPFTGSTWQPDLVLLGEAPGANEDQAGKPFVGRAGKLLDEMLVRGGTSRKQCVITNSACCRPPSNRDPEWAELQSCEPNRKAQVQLARTVVGMTMGRIALAALTGDPSIKIGQHRGKPFWAEGKVWVPTYHPAYALRQKHAEAQIVGDIKLAVKMSLGSESLPVNPEWPPYEVINNTLVVRDESVVVENKIWELVKGVTYTREEWERLKYFTEIIPAINLMKKDLGATVIK